MLFGESRLNPFGIIHKILQHQKNSNTFLFDKVDHNLILSESQLSDLLVAERSTLSQDDRAKLIEHELSEIKVIINRYVLKT